MIDKELSEVQRQTIILYYYNGLKTNEIASIMNCPEGTVKYRLSAARDKIKEAVLIYEKKNKDRLHAIVPIPILTLILRSEAEHTVVPNIRLFHNPAASAKHLKTGGKAIMKKALTGKVIAAAAAVVVVGGGITAAIALNKNNDSNISEQDSGSSNVILDNSDSSDIDNSPTDNSSESTTDTQTETETESETIPEKEPVTLDWAGFSITLPYEFRENWGINNSANYYRIKYRDTEDAIHVQYSAFSLWEYNLFFSSREDPEHRPEEVRDIVYDDLYFLDTHQDNIYGSIDGFHHYSDPNRTVFSVDEEESLELDGCPFLKQSGILTLEKRYGGSYDVSYVAYYGVIPDKYTGGDRPFVLFFHTQSTKPEIIAEMRETAKTVAENGVYVGEDT